MKNILICLLLKILPRVLRDKSVLGNVVCSKSSAVLDLLLCVFTWSNMQLNKMIVAVKPIRSNRFSVNPSPAEPGYTLLLQTVQIQISWLLNPKDLD